MNIQVTATIPADKERIASIPTTTGVYLFLSAEKKILYIGKSISLRARLLSHIENAKQDAKEAAIGEHSTHISYIVTDSEFHALLLESRLISQHKPKYNVRWRDDKSYLYIKVTIQDTYPKMFLTRREDDHKSLYFGPMPSVKTAENIIREIRRIFPFCIQKKIYKRPCFYSKIGLCNPCPNTIEQEPNPEKKKNLQREYRSSIRQAVKVLEGNIEKVRIKLSKELTNQTKNEQYEEAIHTRDRLFRIEGLLYHKRSEIDDIGIYNRSEERMNLLITLLQRYDLPIESVERIECYDVSNHAQKDATASMVVFTNGLMDKKEYKRFKIKDLSLQSDFEMMEEVLRRRFAHTWPLPNLIVIDGGKPQLRFVMRVCTEQRISVPCIGIAKRPDRLILGLPNLPMARPPHGHLGFSLVQAIRDEAHRFAKKYHTYLKNKNILKIKT